MPLCPQITNTPITVVQNSDFTVSSVVPVVPATTTQVNTAQATANTALANAATAYTTAVNSLQPSAYAIQNPTTKQLTAIDATGLTVWSGASATSGARVVMNSLGLAGYNAAGSPTFSITASTGAAVFSGSITGSAITGSTLNINGNAIIDASGFLTASGATLTGTVNATSGYIGSASTGWQFTSSGYLYSSDTTLYPTTSPGGNANTYALYTNRGVYAEKLFITNTQSASIYTSGGVYALGQLSIAASGGSALFAVNTSGAITAVAGITASGAITTSGNISTSGSGNITAAGSLYAAGHTTTPSTANGYVNASTGLIARSTASSQRYKHDIVNLMDVPELSPKKLYDLPVRAFRFNDGYITGTDDRAEMLVPGFIAEEVDAIYPVSADYVEGIGVETWNDRMIVPAMLALIQDQHKRIQALEGK